MPKKLTKTQVKRILNSIANGYQRMFNDKYAHTNQSHVPFSAQKLASKLFESRTESNKVK
jgi:ribosomal protein S17E|tara:strand:+ start:637 stop:816 length:180 start_codon:yes stop_codon:yes gene_type:complete